MAIIVIFIDNTFIKATGTRLSISMMTCICRQISSTQNINNNSTVTVCPQTLQACCCIIPSRPSGDYNRTIIILSIYTKPKPIVIGRDSAIVDYSRITLFYDAIFSVTCGQCLHTGFPIMYVLGFYRMVGKSCAKLEICLLLHIAGRLVAFSDIGVSCYTKVL